MDTTSSIHGVDVLLALQVMKQSLSIIPDLQ